MLRPVLVVLYLLDKLIEFLPLFVGQGAQPQRLLPMPIPSHSREPSRHNLDAPLDLARCGQGRRYPSSLIRTR
jgi:hypothetical protein